MYLVFHHVPDPVAAAVDIARVLRPAGRVLIRSTFRWPVADEAGPRPGAPPEDGWALLRPPSGPPAVSLAFEFEADYVRPTWPSVAGEQEIMAHIDIAAENLGEAVEWAVGAGATLAEHQPREHVRVMLDPAGHPFCLFAGRV